MAAGQVPWVDVQLHPYLVTLELDADVTGWPPRPLDGIDRLRRRLGQ
jgi:hypothetical protein